MLCFAFLFWNALLPQAFQHLKHEANLNNISFYLSILLPKKASTKQLTPLIALKKIWGSCFKHGCSTTSWGIPLELRNCSWNFGVVLTIAGLLRSTGLLDTNIQRSKFTKANRKQKAYIWRWSIFGYMQYMAWKEWKSVFWHLIFSAVRGWQSCIMMMLSL